jgi:hypothetical protein
MVRLIEAANVLLQNSGSWGETMLLKLARMLYQQRLRQVIARLPADITGEILVASESVGGKAPLTHGLTMN